jgi:hypothetical protein
MPAWSMDITIDGIYDVVVFGDSIGYYYYNYKGKLGSGVVRVSGTYNSGRYTDYRRDWGKLVVSVSAGEEKKEQVFEFFDQHGPVSQEFTVYVFVPESAVEGLIKITPY